MGYKCVENKCVQVAENADFADARVRPDLGIRGAEAVIWFGFCVGATGKTDFSVLAVVWRNFISPLRESEKARISH